MTNAFRDIAIEQLCTKVTTGATPLRSRNDYYEAGTIDWYKTGELTQETVACATLSLDFMRVSSVFLSLKLATPE